MSDLPRGWEWATLDDVGDYFNGRAFKNAEWSTEGRPIVRIQNLTGTSKTFNYFSGVLDERHTARDGDLLISWAATLGSYIWRGPEAAVNQHIFKVRSYIDIRFHHYLVAHLISQLYSRAQGSGMVHVTRAKFGSLEFKMPPLAEQRRIVAALEDHLSHLDTGKAVLMSAQQRSMLVGRSYVQKLLEGLAPDRTLGSVLREPLRNGYSGRASQDGNGIRTLTLTAVTRAEFSDEYTKITKVDGRKVDDLWLEPGDLLVQRSNTPELVGTSALYAGPRNWAIFPDLLIRVRTNREVSPTYAHVVLSSPKVHRVLRQSAKGLAGSMPKIDQGTLEALLIPVPPVVTQERIVQLAEEFNRKLKRLRVDLAITQMRGESLRRSLLAEAFAGRLVPQNSDDEPASVLLERIRAERAAQTKPRRARRTRQTDTTQEALL